MKLGITGTRQGWTEPQSVTFESFISDMDVEEFHHGDCVGVDEQACQMVERMWGSPIHTHPPTNATARAYVPAGRLYLPKDYIERNHDIVDAVDLLVVVPAQHLEQKRSGTWATYRYAKKVNTAVFVIYPDGTYETDQE